jgi:NDP-sugar pyrophosphorylase family protein
LIRSALVLRSSSEWTPVGVVPAAGYARRLRPMLSGSKEIYPIGGRPVIDYLLERMVAARCKEIRVVTRPEKRDVANHARARGASVVLARPRSVSESFLAGIRGLEEKTAVVLGFPDTLWQPRDGFVRLLAALGPGLAVALGIFRAEDPGRADVVHLEGDRVTGIDVKPENPLSDLVWGCAATWVGVLRGLEGHAEPGHHFDELAQRGLVRGVRLSDPFVDIGTPEALRRARERGVSGVAEG